MDKLFSEGRVGSLVLPNRLIRSATAERMATPAGLVTEPMIDLYRALAAGGAGLIIAGHSYIRADGRAGPTMSALDRDETIPGWRRLVEAVHDEGGRIAAQINHGGRQAMPALDGTPRAPSPVSLRGVTPQPLEEDEIWALVDVCRMAARRAKQAGFDAVQIHAAHGYLISNFNSPFTNRRQDAWGGDVNGRGRFAREVALAVRRELGATYPLFIKLNASDGVEGGISRQDAVQIARRLEGAGLDAVEVSGGTADAIDYAIRRIQPGQEAYFAADARALKQSLRIPVILVGGIRSFEVASRLLEDGTADFISMCRPLIREPDLPRRWQRGERRAADCISCGLCRKYQDRGVRCEEMIARPNRSTC